MHNLPEYSSNYSDMTGSLWFYSKDGATNFDNDTRILTSLSLSSIRLYY